MAGVQIATSIYSIPPDYYNGGVPTSQHMMPPQTPRMPALPQQPPPAPATQRVPTGFSGLRVDLLV